MNINPHAEAAVQLMDKLSAKFPPNVANHVAQGGCGGDLCRRCGGTGNISYYEGSKRIFDQCDLCHGRGMR